MPSPGAAAPILAALAPALAAARRPLVVGLGGAQGAGKSTVAAALADALAAGGRRAAVLSLDDLYLDRAARARLADTVHPLFATRGPPGTHDVALGAAVLDGLAAGAPVALPRFDKAADAPRPPAEWPTVNAPGDASAAVVVFEGWCVGARPEPASALGRPVNALEAAEDPDGRWRRAVRAALGGAYQALWARVDVLAFLAAPGWDVVPGWRLEQERALAAAGGRGAGVMDAAGVARFVQYFERVTRHMLAELPARADVTVRLDARRRVVGVEGRPGAWRSARGEAGQVGADAVGVGPHVAPADA
jgi:D-glycerate 3-kinase